MLKKILKSPSTTLISIPYVISYGKALYSSDHFNTYSFILLISTLILFDLILNRPIKIHAISYFIYIFIVCYILTLYGLYLSPLIHKLNDFNINLRGRNLIAISLISLSILPKIFPKILTRGFYILNTFILIYSCTLLLGQIINYKAEKQIIFKAPKKPIIFNNSSKPILLLISDEYSSPTELFKLSKDSTLFNFTNKLKLDGWITIEESYSKEISTIHSLSSIFNYNLSNNIKYSSESLDNIGSKYLQNCELYKQSLLYNIPIINFGIFQIGYAKQFSRLYYYPENFMELVLMYTIIPQILQNTGGFTLKGFKQNYYPMMQHNKYILEKMSDSLVKINNKHIVYVHLFMPHSPHSYYDEFKLRNESIYSYLSFWKFTNNKLYPLLNELKKKYKVVLTGDHGYRHDIRINPHLTYTAFYGFTKEELDQIKVIQDLGNLLIPLK